MFQGNKNFKKGFALLYVILFVFLIVITVLVTWATSMAESRMHRRTEGTTQAYQLAKAGLDEGWEKYHDEDGIGDRCTIDPVTIPTDAYSNSLMKRYTVGDNQTNDTAFLTEGISFSDSIQGVYDYRVYNNGGIATIDGIGYYKGTQVTLRGEVKHASDEDEIINITDPDTGAEICSRRNHKDDTLFIYQIGPLDQ